MFIMAVDKKHQRMTINLLLKFLVSNGILTQAEGYTAITTGLLPDDILIRLKIADNAYKN